MSATEPLYKVLTRSEDGLLHSCHHLCRARDLLDWVVEDGSGRSRTEVWIAESAGDAGEATDKVVVGRSGKWALGRWWSVCWPLDPCHVGLSRARGLALVGVLDDRTLRLLAADCGERPLLRERAANREPAPASWAAVQAARDYAEGRIDAAALAASMDAACAVASSAASSAVNAAASSAVNAAAWAAAWDARSAAAWAAASAAALAAASAAVRAAAWAAAWAASRDAERQWQGRRLLTYLRGGPVPPVTLETP